MPRSLSAKAEVISSLARAGLAGDAHVDVGELALEARHHAAHTLDGPAVSGEAAGLALRLGQDEQQPLVVGEEVAGPGAVAADREQRPPRRLVGRRPLGPGGDLADQVAHEAQVERALALLGQAEVEEATHERVGDLRGHAVHELVERGAGGEGLHELLIVEDALADLLQVLERQVEELPAPRTAWGRCGKPRGPAAPAPPSSPGPGGRRTGSPPAARGPPPR